MREKRDSQKGRVYKSEHQCSFYHFKQTIPSDELQEWTENNILSKPWFRKRYGNRYPKVELGRSRGVAYGSSLIRLGTKMRNPWVICHEVAHTLNVGDSHGPAFARTFIFLIERVVGKDEAAELERHMRANRVKIKPKSWLPKPTRNPEPYDFDKTYKPSRYRAQLKRKMKGINDVQRAARKIGAEVEFERIKNAVGEVIPGEWDLTVIAPAGYVWLSEGTERATVTSDGSRLETYSYRESYLSSSEAFDDAIFAIEQGIKPKGSDAEVTAKAAATVAPRNEGEMKVTVKAIKATDDNGWSWETHIHHDNQEVEVRQYKTGADRKGLYRMVADRWAEVFGDEFVVKGRNSVYGKAKRLAMKEAK